jgi:hypothetical protein
VIAGSVRFRTLYALEQGEPVTWEGTLADLEPGWAIDVELCPSPEIRDRLVAWHEAFRAGVTSLCESREWCDVENVRIVLLERRP